ATIAAAFFPKAVIVRLSDFKSNEYSNLLGGSRYEPHEENPMLGFRGASRYVAREFYDCFALECEAMRRGGDGVGFANGERGVAVKAILRMAISACRARGCYVGICGQGPSDHPDLAQWLVEQGIESISLNPDTVVSTWMMLANEPRQ